jgi:predicted secreted hydrolase
LATLLLTCWILAAGFTYREALPNQPYQFPRDHFEHADYKTEWWYYTGNLRDTAGKRYGFELVFFRQGARGKDVAGNESAWRIDDLYLAHAAVTGIDADTFHYTERLNRAGPGLAGASFAERRIWNGNWQAKWDGENQQITALAEDFRFQLKLEPAKPYVIHGLNGVSQKAEGSGKASHYVSFPRLRVSGTLDGRDVQGDAWMDHEWFTEQLDTAQTGWDWFSAQFDDNTELMLFDLRRKDGTIDPYSSGTFVDQAGKAHHLKAGDFTLRATAFWQSPKSKGRYPTEWQIEIPSLHVSVKCRAARQNQELVGQKNATAYWEGAVVYSGTNTGRGYLEMTGYDKPVRF